MKKPYQIYTNHWAIVNGRGDIMEHWKDFDEPISAIRNLAYLRFAYPDHSHTLHDGDGWIISTHELRKLAAWLILDDVPEGWTK